ncbi:MAG: GNAT family N-acetyltransferase [Hyphomicrobiales bacterium]|nr:GNAT family N-acetyltransferase [Hyphomicrobiales bacterium]MCP4999487.1 GNAT family N-acetyltransferase [Hyphomicrobiales bacterium]
MPKGTVEIGWRLAAGHWRNGYATEAAEELLRLGFEERGLEEIESFAVHDNTRSTAVMECIGLRHDPARDFDHPGVPEIHAHLRRHVLYALTADEWRQRLG